MTSIFDFERLPIVCLSKIADYLNTRDIIKLLEAIYNCDLKNLSESSTNLLKIIFNPKQLNLEECYRLKLDEFKRIYSLFNKLHIELLNLNFCFSLNSRWEFRPRNRLKTLALLNFTQLKSLTEFHAIDFVLDEDALISLISQTQLKSISFAEEIYIFHRLMDELKDKVAQIEKVKILVRSSDSMIKMMSLFSNAISIEVYSNSEIQISYFAFDVFLQFKRIEEFITGSGKIVFFVNGDQLFSFFKRLKTYCVYVSHMDILKENIGQFKYVNHLINVDYVDIKGSDSSRNPMLDDFLGDKIDRIVLTSTKTRAIEVNNESATYVLKDIERLRLTVFEYLETLDLSSFHIHSSESICKIISHLKNLKILCLPCCSLANRLFKDEYKTKSFMHALDDDDMEQKEDIKTELEHLANLNLTEFKLLCLNPLNRKLDKNCTNVEFADIIAISKWTELKSLTLRGFKINGGPENFRQAFEGISRLKRLERFRVVNLLNFETYNYQVIFLSLLKNFEVLKYFNLEQTQLFFDQRFLSSILEMTSSLQSLHLSLNYIDINLIKSGLNDLQRALAGLVRIKIKGLKNKQEDIKYLRKSFEKILPDTVAIHITGDTFVGEERDQDRGGLLQLMKIYNRLPTLKFKDF